MSFREEQKAQREKVSGTLIHGALELCAAEGYASLSLRSVARKAGIAPTSFYRHFRDMDELGTTMADMAAREFSQCLELAAEELGQAPARADGPTAPGIASMERAVAGFVDSLFACLAERPNLFWFFLQERTGSSGVLRETIGKAMEEATLFLAQSMAARGYVFQDPETVAATLLGAAAEQGLLTLLPENPDPQPFRDRAATQCALVLLGAVVS